MGGLFPFPLIKRRPQVLEVGAHLTAITSGLASAVIVERVPAGTDTGARLGATLVASVSPRAVGVTLMLGARLQVSPPVLRDPVQIVAGRLRGCLAGRVSVEIDYEGEDLWLLGLTLEQDRAEKLVSLMIG